MLQQSWSGDGLALIEQIDRIRRTLGLAVEASGSNNWAVSGAFTDSGRSLLAGDPHQTLQNPNTFWPGQLNQPKDYFTPDPPRNRDSARRLAKLEPALVCFGHGPPLRDTKRFTDFVAGLPGA